MLREISDQSICCQSRTGWRETAFGAGEGHTEIGAGERIDICNTALLDLLEYDWRTNRTVIKRDTAARNEFSSILKVMLDRQIPRAMELQDQIARTC